MSSGQEGLVKERSDGAARMRETRKEDEDSSSSPQSSGLS